MKDRMQTQPFGEMMTSLLAEYRAYSTLAGVPAIPAPLNAEVAGELYGRALETPVGPAAGPNTQLAGNIVAAYAAGARFFELKTVQLLDGEQIKVEKPCIAAPDEGYNIEWSTELTVAEAAAEYVKAYYAIMLLSREFSLGREQGFVFNMSVGYDLAGIRHPKMDGFIEMMKNAAPTEIWRECCRWAAENVEQFQTVDMDYIRHIDPCICSGATISTLHGCPPAEIEGIARWLLAEKELHTHIKLNPTLLGYEKARSLLDGLGYEHLRFDDHHFRSDLQMADALPMLERLLEEGEKRGLTLGVKLTNTLPVQPDQPLLSGNELYLSGRALFPLAVELAAMLAERFEGRLPISFCGGADAFNIAALLRAGLQPLTMATTLLKPGGYQRLTQLTRLVKDIKPPQQPNALLLRELADQAAKDQAYAAGETGPGRKLPGAPPLFDCFSAPCVAACPLGQDIPAYLAALADGDKARAAAIILERNPLPHITGSICPHTCMDNCNRRFYEQAVDIRGCKLLAAESGISAALRTLKIPSRGHDKAAIIGGGPAGLATAAFLAMAGWQPILYEAEDQLGGLPRRLIPDFRLSRPLVDKDVELVRSLGAQLRTNSPIRELKPLLRDHAAIFVAVGAGQQVKLALEQGQAIGALDFLTAYNNGETGALGKSICVVGGGNTAVDAARAALRIPGKPRVSLVYRRDRSSMPADKGELAQAIREGVQLHTLLRPLSLSGGELLCRRMILGAPDASGRRAPVDSDETVTLPCDTVIAAVGQKPDADFLKALDIQVDERGLPLLDEHSRLVNNERIFVVGDCGHGPATVAEAIASALAAVEHLTGHSFDAYRALDAAWQGRAGRGVLARRQEGEAEAGRCLECGGFCANCVECCPNRANILVEAAGGQQIVHIDALCNSCGNCAIFCPYEEAPFRHKLTLFSDLSSFEESQTDGWVALTDKHFLTRNRGLRREFNWTRPDTPTLPQLVEALAEYYH